MERVREPELMDDPDQALAYARADFEEENQGFVDRFVEFYPEFKAGHVLDLGCGPADIPIRLARKLPECRITGVDGSPPMIAIGLDVICVAGLADRIALRCERFQDTVLPERANAVISNSLLHHVPNPLQFWYTVKKLAQPGETPPGYGSEDRRGAKHPRCNNECLSDRRSRVDQKYY